MQTVFLNGEYMPREEATISPDDRGFLFSDGVYEVVRAYDGRLFELQRHTDRLAASLDAMNIRGVQARELGDVCEALVERNGLADSDSLVYMQVTRGVAPRTHRFPNPPVEPTVYAYAWAFSPEHPPEEGVRAITVPDQRWARCDIKTVGLIPNCLANEAANEAAAAEAIFVRDGVALEGTHTNLFAVFRRIVRTAPLTNYILAGITRAVVLELCAEAGYEVEEVPILLDDVYRANEIFIAGTTAEVTPVTDLDGRTVGAGRPGEISLRLLELLRNRARGFAARAD
jgi:D-alanine transaminase